MFSHRHGPGQSHDHKAIFIASHGFQHIRGFAELAACERRLGHGTHQIINRVNVIQVQRLQRHQTVFHRIVQMTMDAAAVVITVMFQGCTSPSTRCEAILY